jgi:hypothetical protein
MLPGSAAKTNFGIALGILSGWILYDQPFGMLPLNVVRGIAILGVLSYGWGCYNYAVGKGHNALVALIGFVPMALFFSVLIPGFNVPSATPLLILAGLAILAVLPDFTKPTARNQRMRRFRGDSRRVRSPEDEPKSRSAGLAIAIVLVAALGGVGWMAHRSRNSQSEDEARNRAVQQYPALGVADSPLNREFRARYYRYRFANPAYFNNKEWPLHLAAESQAALAQGQAHR